MNIKLLKKFTNNNLDEFVNKIYLNYKLRPNDKYYFDLSDVEYIGNQELLVLSALFKSFVESNIDFEVEFFKKNTPSYQINIRVKRQIIQFWEVWKIWQITPKDSYDKYFGIDGNAVQRLQYELNYFPKLSEIYNRYGITPFVTLDFINNYDEENVENIIQSIYRLNSVIEELLISNKCHHPFTSNSLSTIITEELYHNFLDHSQNSSFANFKKFAFMSISFNLKLDEKKINQEEIQRRKALNFREESLKEAKGFFYDKIKKRFKNQSYIEFSFLDFGQGIPATLKEQYNLNFNDEIDNKYDSNILKYAFRHNSSRHPIIFQNGEKDRLIPRGLFDALTIVRRYNGLLIIRSNYGKILFDFSLQTDIDKAFSYFGDDTFYFPGTLISIYIAAIEDVAKLKLSAIKPEIVFASITPDKKKYVNVNDLFNNIKSVKEEEYNSVFNNLQNIIHDEYSHSLVFLSFKGVRVDKRILKKIIYYLLTNYEINSRNNVVIINSPQGNLIEEISSELLLINDALKYYKIHPLPIIDFDNNSENLNIRWLGIYDDKDKDQLKNLLFEQYSIARTDFNDPENITGHLNEFDSFGNLISNFPNKNDIISFFRQEDNFLMSKQVEDLLINHNCIKKDDGNSLFLCNDNYYQKEYIELNNLVNNKKDCDTITELIYRKIIERIKTLEGYKFISITTTSNKILKSLQSQNLISNEDYISLESYHNFEADIIAEVIDKHKKYILICDVISTGNLTRRLNSKLKELGTCIELVSVVASIIDPKYETTQLFVNDFDDKTIYLFKYPIEKFKREDLGDNFFAKKIIRINPHTNIPITLSINETNFSDSIVFESLIEYKEDSNTILIKNKFLDCIGDDSINVGFYKFNNLIHPYFFDTNKILNSINEEIIKSVFDKINNSKFQTDPVQVFYPRKSGISFFDFNILKELFKNYSLEEVEIERFNTPEGWRFPHNIDYLNSIIKNSFCFIIDDGSCSGDSIIQMIDEISFYDVKEIVLLCIIGRVQDHKREFFSRLSRIKVKDKKEIDISIFFVCHFHVPTYYLDENPNITESNWLKEILKIQNTPQSIKNIASNILKELVPKTNNNFKDYKYLPKSKLTNAIPKKDILNAREEIGKVIGYRLYKESFIYFDFFVKKYEKKIRTPDRYKEIELLCATFIFEPYLYEKIKGVLSDVIKKIEEFVLVLIFSNEKIYDSLTYKWSKKDIVHLFFIVFQNEQLLQQLTIERFQKLINFTEQVDSTINYILYKLLKYIPLNPSQFTECRFDGQIKNLIYTLKNVETIPNKEIKKFYNFITSLPSRSDFYSQLTFLKDSYLKQKEQEFHNEKKSLNHNISEIIVTIRGIIFDIEQNINVNHSDINIIRICWFKIFAFLNPILRFSSTFIDFLTPYTFYELFNKTTSLREMVGYIDDFILSDDASILDIEKLRIVKKYISQIQTDFELNSVFHQVIEQDKSNLLDFILILKHELGLKFNISEVGEKPLNKHMFDVPKLYTEKLIVNEIITNMKKYSKDGVSNPVIFQYNYIQTDKVQIIITNAILDSSSKFSNGEGTKCLRLMSESSLFGFTYKFKKEAGEFFQFLTFDLL